jgi:hypothetical protein
VLKWPTRPPTLGKKFGQQTLSCCSQPGVKYKDMALPSDKWRHFERLVAAIHRAADQGADVRWNETIRGRQFDVTIRFRKGLYEYLTVIECKCYDQPVSVEKVEAFVTKSTDVQAHCAVMASTSGFQRGARDVAGKHNVTLIHVTDSSNIDLSPFRAQWAGTTKAFHIDSIELEYVDGQRKQLPNAANVLTYYVGHIVLQTGTGRRTLDDLIFSRSLHTVEGKVDVYEDHVVDCAAGTSVVAPDDGEIPLKPLLCVRIRSGITEARVLTGPVIYDPYLIVPDVNVRNVSTGEEKAFSQHGLAIGVNNKFVEGGFYEQPQLASFYFCEVIRDGIARLYMVESFQHGNLIQALFTVKAEFADRYVPVQDKTTIGRLERRLDRLRRRRPNRN